MKLRHLKKLIKESLPGFITGGADNDPAGIATYSISGATFGFAQLWLMVLATPMLIAVQSMCAKLGNVQRKGLSVILREQFSPTVGWIAAGILIIANIFTIGADLVAMSAVSELVTGIKLIYWILPFTIMIWYIVLFKNYKKISRFLLWMVAFFAAYIIAAFLSHPNWTEVFRYLVLPPLHGVSKSYYIAAVAILGTTITPYLFFWQVKEEMEEHKTKASALAEVSHEDRTTAPGFIYSQVITIFIIIATGATLFRAGISIESAADAAKALTPIAGSAATWLFAIGILGAGFLAIPVLSASTAYVVAETAGWKHDSLSSKIHTAKGFYAVITLSLFAGIAVVISGISPIKALYYSQILNGLLAPFLLVLIIILANRKKVMGELRNGWFDNFFGTLAILIMFAAGILIFI